MIVSDPGHEYLLDHLDSPNGTGRVQRLYFVKREGPKYPGNVGSHPGTTMQEVLRALIERGAYVNRQLPCVETESVIGLLTAALVLLETRAARIHGRPVDFTTADVVSGVGKCLACGHVGCKGCAKIG